MRTGQPHRQVPRDKSGSAPSVAAGCRRPAERVVGRLCRDLEDIAVDDDQIGALADRVESTVPTIRSLTVSRSASCKTANTQPSKWWAPGAKGLARSAAMPIATIGSAVLTDQSMPADSGALAAGRLPAG